MKHSKSTCFTFHELQTLIYLILAIIVILSGVIVYIGETINSPVSIAGYIFIAISMMLEIYVSTIVNRYNKR